MPPANNTILVLGTIIIGIGFVNAQVNNRPKTPVFAGGIGVLLLASLLDAAGPRPAELATAILGLATITVVLVEGPSLFTAITTSQKVK